MAFDFELWKTMLLASTQGLALESGLLEAAGLIEPDYLEQDIAFLMAEIEVELCDAAPKPTTTLTSEHLDQRWSQARTLNPGQLRDLSKKGALNGRTRTLIESIMSRRVIAALDDWRQTGASGVLIGTLARNHYVEPRYEDEIAVLVPEGSEAFHTVRFVAVGRRMLRHTETGAKLRVLSPSALQLSQGTAERVVASAVVSDGVKLASAAGFVATMLGDRSSRASADIVSLSRLGVVDVTGFGLPEHWLSRLENIQAEADLENRRAAERQARNRQPYD